MPRIIVTSDGPTDRVLHSERVSPSDFETAHFRTQLAERVAWAVDDAERVGSDGSDARAGGDEAARFERVPASRPSSSS
jgi:hypothetical protein